jgi:hypothetical protein
MRKLRFLLIFACVSLSALPLFAQQPPPPPVAGVNWSITPDQMRQLAPGTLAGETLIYQTEFAGYQAIGQYYFEYQHGQPQLRQATYYPYYVIPRNWQPEYDHIAQYLTGQYGNPAQTGQNMMLWTPQGGQTALRLYPSGWQTQFQLTK